MKRKSFYGVLLTISAMYITACAPEKPVKTETVFAGNILNNATNEIRIENEDTVMHAFVNYKGEFKLRFHLEKESAFDYIGNEMANVYFSPGDSIHLYVDAKDWRTFDKSLTFSGKGSEKNTYFITKYLIQDELLDSRKRELFQMNEKGFMSILDSICNILKNNFISFKKDHPGEKYGLLSMELESIDYLKKTSLIQYYLFNHMHDNGRNEISGRVAQIINSLNLNDEAHTGLDTYKQLIFEYLNYLNYKQGIENNRAALFFALKNIDDSIQNRILKESIARSVIESYISKNGWSEEILPELKGQIGSESYLLFSVIADNLKPISAGSKAPDFKLYDFDGNEYSLSSFASNYIYMDVWASYCSPCLKEVPYFEQLKSDFKENNISFISVSLDRKEGDWLSTTRKHKMTKFQLRPENDWSSDFVHDYSLNHYGIPYYILIDTQGSVMKLMGPKPSEAKTLLNEIFYKSAHDNANNQ